VNAEKVLHTAVLAAACIGAISGAALAQEAPKDQCYKFARPFFLALTAGSEAGRSAFDSSAVVRLVGAAELDRGVVVPVGVHLESDQQQRYSRFSGWTRSNSDPISIAWRNGFWGPVFEGVIQGDSIIGRVRFTSDEGPEPKPELTSAILIPCPVN
jgi:hypothetical protein